MTDCWESVGGSNVVSGVNAQSWESTFLKWNILEIGCAMCRWNETMCSDSVWPWSGYHRGLNIPPYTGFSSPRGCVSANISSSLWRNSVAKGRFILTRHLFSLFVFFPLVTKKEPHQPTGVQLNVNVAAEGALKCHFSAKWWVGLMTNNQMWFQDQTFIIWCHF